MARTRSDKCKFCSLGDVMKDELGPLYRKGSLVAHQNCLYFSSGLSQNGETGNGILGFLEKDIEKEFARGMSHPRKCVGCKKKGMFVGCAESRCKDAGHLPCLINQEYLLQFRNNFEAYCPTHQPKQIARFPSRSPDPYSCPICLADIPRPSVPDRPIKFPFSLLLTPCCNNVCHRQCVQRHARSAAAHFFRCPVCNNIDKFCEEMLRMGVEVPIRDASWELCSGLFSDLHSPTVHCNLPNCTNSGGRGRHSEDNEVVDCSGCGQCIGHYQCIKRYLHDPCIVMVTQRGVFKEYICNDCAPVYKKRKWDSDETTPTKPPSKRIQLDEDRHPPCCLATQCSCIYGRDHISPSGLYQVVYCSTCEKCLGHSECLTQRNGEVLLCDGCGPSSCHDNKEGCGRLLSPKVTNSDDVIYISSASDDDSGGRGSKGSRCGLTQSGRDESLDNEWKLSPRNLLNCFNGTSINGDTSPVPAALNSCSEFKLTLKKTPLNNSRPYCDTGPADITRTPCVVVSPIAVKNNDNMHGSHDDVHGCRNNQLSMSYAGQCRTQ